MHEILSNGLGVKHSPTSQHVVNVGHECRQGGREGGVEGVVEEEEVHPAVVQDQRTAASQDQGHERVWRGGGA